MPEFPLHTILEKFGTIPFPFLSNWRSFSLFSLDFSKNSITLIRNVGCVHRRFTHLGFGKFNWFIFEHMPAEFTVSRKLGGRKRLLPVPPLLGG
jgi:hypothetical protein